MELSALSLRLRALSVLRGLLSHPLVRAYGDTLTALDGTAADFADRYGALCATRFSCGDIAQAVLDAVHFDTNTLTNTINAPEAAVLNAATHDLDVLNALLALDGEAFKSGSGQVLRACPRGSAGLRGRGLASVLHRRSACRLLP